MAETALYDFQFDCIFCCFFSGNKESNSLILKAMETLTPLDMYAYFLAYHIYIVSDCCEAETVFEMIHVRW